MHDTFYVFVNVDYLVLDCFCCELMMCLLYTDHNKTNPK